MRCPVCRAENDREPACRRCKADLTLLLALEDRRRHALDAVARAVSEGRGAEALRHARTAHALRADDESLRGLALAYLLHRQFAGALACYRHLARNSTA